MKHASVKDWKTTNICSWKTINPLMVDYNIRLYEALLAENLAVELTFHKEYVVMWRARIRPFKGPDGYTYNEAKALGLDPEQLLYEAMERIDMEASAYWGLEGAIYKYIEISLEPY